METTSMVISIILTVVILLLTVLTISKGYGFKHTIDPVEPLEKNEDEQNKDSKTSWNLKKAYINQIFVYNRNALVYIMLGE